jgi:hypothetical protein
MQVAELLVVIMVEKSDPVQADSRLVDAVNVLLRSLSLSC